MTEGFMLLSMTGFGKAEGNYKNIHFTIEVKSVNNRYIDISTVIPRKVAFLELPVRDYLQKNLTRGKILFILHLTGDTGEISRFQLNEKLLSEIMRLADRLKEDFGVEGRLTLSDIFLRDDLIELQEAELEEEALQNEILSVTGKALEQLKSMEKREGDYLKELLLNDLNSMEKEILTLESNQQSNLDYHIELFKDRVSKLRDQFYMDESRLFQEVVLLVDKLDISEEIQRFKSHIEQFNVYLNHEETVGKRLNFLLQEMHREINTLGNKAANAHISQKVVELKNRLEIMREQVQNIQ